MDSNHSFSWVYKRDILRELKNHYFLPRTQDLWAFCSSVAGKQWGSLKDNLNVANISNMIYEWFLMLVDGSLCL